MKKNSNIAAKLLIATIVLMAGMGLTAYAGEWQQNSTGWQYHEDNGYYSTNCWQWIDGNGDGVAECYYFDGNGYMLSNTTTPDGFLVDASGAWMINGVVQTQQVDPHTNPVNVETGNTTGNEVTDGKSVSQITLNHELTDLLGVSDGVNSLKDKRVVEQDEFRTVYMMDYNGRQLNISVTKLDNAPTTYIGEVESILKNVPQTGIELNAFYDNTGFKDADNGRRIVASTGRSDQIFGLTTGTYRMTRCNVDNKHFEIVLTQGADENWYIYPNSAIYIQTRY